jgi:hypothetical protein
MFQSTDILALVIGQDKKDVWLLGDNESRQQ